MVEEISIFIEQLEQIGNDEVDLSLRIEKCAWDMLHGEIK